jgi:hypothetical protein
MPDPIDTLSLLANASIVITGLAGVAAALGRRAEGNWTPLERARLINLFVSSLTVLFLSLIALTALHADLRFGTTWRLSSGLWCLSLIGFLVLFRKRLEMASSQDPQRAGTFTRALISSGNVFFVVVNLLNVVWFGEFWLFLMGQVWLFGLGCHAFVRLVLFLGPDARGKH